MINFHSTYSSVLTWVLQGSVETNVRTGVRTRVGRGGTSFRVDLSNGLLPIIGGRKTFPKSAAAEIAWYLQGSQDITFIKKYASLWNKFTETIIDKDGNEFIGVKSAYGYRWKNHFERDQIKLVIETLRKDSTDRRCYVSAWDPRIDGLGKPNQLNVPCPAAFTFSILNDELHSSFVLRSSDVFVGLPYDVMGHALLMDIIANELNVQPGVMHVTLAHAHLYEPHWSMTTEMIKQSPIIPQIKLPSFSLSEIEKDFDAYVLHVADEAKNHEWSTYNPKPEIVE